MRFECADAGRGVDGQGMSVRFCFFLTSLTSVARQLAKYLGTDHDLPCCPPAATSDW